MFILAYPVSYQVHKQDACLLIANPSGSLATTSAGNPAVWGSELEVSRGAVARQRSVSSPNDSMQMSHTSRHHIVSRVALEPHDYVRGGACLGGRTQVSAR